MWFRVLSLPLLLTSIALGSDSASAEKPEKIPVALGSWKGPHAGSFKSALRRGLLKECVFVRAKAARVTIDGEVTEQGKRFSVRVLVNSTKTGELFEQHTYSYARPTLSDGQSNKLGHDVAEVARRAPLE